MMKVELVLYATSTTLSCLVLFVGLQQLDPNHEASRKALDVINPDHIHVEFNSIGGLKTAKQALYELDGFNTDQNAQVKVLVATNRPSELDEAIFRRLPRAFEIDIPDQRERAEILNVILKGERIKENIDFDRIAFLCEGYTSLNLFDLCKKATYFPIRKLLDEEKKGRSGSAPRPFSQVDLEKALATSRKTTVVAFEYNGLSADTLRLVLLVYL
ncbi:hypothetical protein VNO80_19211 [Phaseolus coccineus]|uniref:ATPase AAA-type core domain-containing protein n=1 Tax=Phaseolus coccineus TaxID=3886 RepID=A0AAN9MFR2_PHACN